MSQENVEVVLEFFAQWNVRRDPSWFVENSRNDVEIFSRYAEVEGQPFVGPGGVHRWIREIDESFERYDAVADDLRDLGDRVVALGSVRLEGRGSGIVVEQPFAWLFDFQDGRFSRIRFYESPAEALGAVGLSE